MRVNFWEDQNTQLSSQERREKCGAKGEPGGGQVGRKGQPGPQKGKKRARAGGKTGVGFSPKRRVTYREGEVWGPPSEWATQTLRGRRTEPKSMWLAKKKRRDKGGVKNEVEGERGQNYRGGKKRERRDPHKKKGE